MRVRVLILLAAVLVLGSALTGASTAQAPARASATLASGSLGEIGVLRSQGSARRSRRVQADERGVEVASGELVVRGTQASVSARSVRLLGGLVTAYGLRRKATVRGRRVRYEGRVEGLKVGDRMVGAVSSMRYIDLPDSAGAVAVNRGGRAITVVLDRRTNGFRAGTRVSVGNVSAEPAERPAPTATPAPTVAPTATPKARRDRGAAKARRSKQRAARKGKAKRRKAPKIAERLTAKRFAFPVHGKSTIGGPFGAARQIGAHQGNDVFAPFGAPVLAVTDGEIFNVGTLKVSGNRLWLRSEAGDEFFYAHLSAFSPLAVNGRKVKSGDVLGFTGNTGDAEPTPPHVHFEIHPGGGDAIDPEPILKAWRDRRDVPPGAWLSRYGGDTEQRPGALVEVRDFIAGE